MLKDQQDCFHNGGGVSRPLKTWSDFSSIQYIFYSNQSSMVINLRGLDKYEISHTGGGQTDGQTRTEVRTGKIYRFVRSNVVMS